MTIETKAAMVWLSDVMLILMIIQLNAFTVYCWRARNRDGLVMRWLAIREVGLAVFFDFFTVVYWDRRWNVWPWLDLHAAMGFEWYWLPRLVVVTTTAGLFGALIVTQHQEQRRRSTS